MPSSTRTAIRELFSEFVFSQAHSDFPKRMAIAIGHSFQLFVILSLKFKTHIYDILRVKGRSEVKCMANVEKEEASSLLERWVPVCIKNFAECYDLRN